MKLYWVRVLFTVLVRCRSIGQSVRLCTDCLSANQIKEFDAYFNQYTINRGYFQLSYSLVHLRSYKIWNMRHIVDKNFEKCDLNKCWISVTVSKRWPAEMFSSLSELTRWLQVTRIPENFAAPFIGHSLYAKHFQSLKFTIGRRTNIHCNVSTPFWRHSLRIIWLQIQWSLSIADISFQERIGFIENPYYVANSS